MLYHKCKKCLLFEAGENKAYETVKAYLQNLDAQLKVDEQTYKNRLDKCMTCNNLISGMCLKCGCYVEIRAALRDEQCPDFDGRLW